MLVRIAVVAALAVGAGACAKRATAYRFRAPMIDGVAAPEVPPRSVLARLSTADARPPAPAASGGPIRLETPRATPLATRLYSFVGKRDSETSSAAFALAAVGALGFDLAPDARAARDGGQLLERARDRDALARSKPLLGDLVVFDGLQDTGKASLVGVVVSRRDDDTVEFIYLGMGVVRRGYLNARWPTTQRDRAGRPLNTWLRVRRGHYRSGLAGVHFATFVRAERLLR